MNDIIVFTDGSYLSKKRSAGYGIYFPNKETDDVAKPFRIKPLTNQRAELYAIYVALIKIIKNVEDVKNIIIFTDSEYSINTLTDWMYKWNAEGWKGKKNLDLIRDKLYPIISKMKTRIKFTHVTAHTGKKDIISICNQIADAYAIHGALKAVKPELTIDLTEIKEKYFKKKK